MQRILNGVRVHGLIFPCVYLMLGLVFLGLGSALLSFSVEKNPRLLVDKKTLLRGVDDDPSSDLLLPHQPPFSAKRRYPRLTVRERCTAKVRWNETEPDNLLSLRQHGDRWDCIWDYEEELQARYAVLGVLYCVAAPLTWCLGAMHFFLDLEGLRPRRRAGSDEPSARDSGDNGGEQQAGHGEGEGETAEHHGGSGEEHQEERHEASPPSAPAPPPPPDPSPDKQKPKKSHRKSDLSARKQACCSKQAKKK